MTALAPVKGMRPFRMIRGVSALADLADGANLGLPLGVGNVFWVNGTGSVVGGNAGSSNSNDGLTPQTPLLTIKAALAKCVNAHNDVIIVTDYYQATGEDWPISVNKSNVSIIGLQSVLGGPVGTASHPWTYVNAVGAYPAFDIVASAVTISGFDISAGTAAAPCITFDDGIDTVTIDSCRFTLGTWGVELASGDMAFALTVSNCFFSSGLATGGIYINDDPAFCVIVGNIFNRLTNAISIVNGSGHQILDNLIAPSANGGNGLAILLATACNACFINGNHVGYGAELGTTFPYQDDGTVNDNGWGWNTFGQNAVAPV
jgi:hypothetical protein